MNNIFKYILYFSVSISLVSCIENKGEKETIYDGMDSKTQTRMQQYYRQGESLYITNCANCHQQNGKGLGQLYPPLAKSDYLMKDPKKMACLIKNGINGEIVVNGITYNQPMPAQTNLTNIEIAEIITFISNSWGNKSGLHEVSEIEKTAKDCL